MSDDKRGEEVDVTREWRATHGQKSAATRLRIFAAIAWIIAIAGEVADPDEGELSPHEDPNPYASVWRGSIR